jgi:hypothetical protein
MCALCVFNMAMSFVPASQPWMDNVFAAMGWFSAMCLYIALKRHQYEYGNG